MTLKYVPLLFPVHPVFFDKTSKSLLCGVLTLGASAHGHIFDIAARLRGGRPIFDLP